MTAAAVIPACSVEPVDHRCEACRRVRLLTWLNVCVRSRCERLASVAQTAGHDMQRNARPEQQGRVRVPRVVETDRPQPGLADVTGPALVMPSGS